MSRGAGRNGCRTLGIGALVNELVLKLSSWMSTLRSRAAKDTGRT